MTTLRVGLVTPLPPAVTESGDDVTALRRQPAFECFVPDGAELTVEQRTAWRVRPLDERHDPAIDVLIYELADDPRYAAVLDAARSGPPGVLLLRDASLHHLIEQVTLGRGDAGAYVAAMREAHGEVGEHMARLRSTAQRGAVELSLLDGLGPLLDRSIGAIVPTAAAGDLVRLRRPGIPVWVVAEPCAAAIADVAAEARRLRDQRGDTPAAAVQAFLAGGPERLGRALGGGGQMISSMADDHLLRYHESLRRLPPAAPGARLLDIGTIPELLRIIASVWGYDVRGCDHGASVVRRRFLAATEEMDSMVIEADAVDVEAQPLPHPASTFDVVTCWEVLEHLGRDPMHLMWEINRVLKPSGLLLLTTPNVSSLRAVQAVLDGYHPFLWAQFYRTGRTDRHNREYAPREVRWLMEAAGFSTDGVTTVDVWGGGEERTLATLRAIGSPLEDRGDDIIAVARKVGLPVERYPEAFYTAIRG